MGSLDRNGMPASNTVGVDALEARRATIRARLREPGARAVEDLRELVEGDEARFAHDEAVRTAEVEGLVRIHEAMAHMRACETPGEVIDATPRALCDACGFTRAMISQVRGSVWDPIALEIREGVDAGEAEFRAYIESTEIPLRHLLLETELVRRRVPVLVRDPAADPRTFRTLVQVGRTTSYVATPIMPTGRVIGFLHADRFGSGRECDEQDRDALWVFAEHVGLVYERSVLVERLEDQSGRIRAALATAVDTIDELCRREISLARRGVPARTPTPARQHPATSAAQQLLSARECEVLDLLVCGSTNATIARRLVVSEATVKSHMSRILRKLRVGSRVEAVAKYLQLADGAQRPRG